MAWNQLTKLEERILLTAEPTATISGPTDVNIGETLDVKVVFDNTHASDVGFGPYVDLILPVNGADGAAGTDTVDGIDFISATYLGTAVNATTLTFDAMGQASHPFAVDNTGSPLVINGTTGDKLVVLSLPFGSFTAGQTPTEIDVSLSLSNLADLGTVLPITVNGGFQFGGDPLDNPTIDPSIVQSTPANTLNITPTLFTISKSNDGPESETATGPNFQRTYTIEIDVADGQTLTDFLVTDFLDSTITFISGSVTNTGGTGFGILDQPTTGGPQVPPLNNLVARFGTLTGGPGSIDATVSFDYFVARFDAFGNPVVNASTGDETTTENNVRGEADWVPIDVRDTADHFISDITLVDDTLTNRSIAIQKAVTLQTDNNVAGFSSGDVVEYTLDVQISDYFTFGDLVITDTLGDGLRFDAGFTPTLRVTEAGGTLAVSSFNLANFTHLDNSLTTGSEILAFNLSNEVITRIGGDGVLAGGLAAPPFANLGATSATVTFRAIIQDQYDIVFPSGEPEINQGDTVTNDVVVSGTIRDNGNQGVLLGVEDDNSSASVEIIRGAVAAKEIVFVNGVAPVGAVQVAAGDEVTYKISYNLPISSAEDLVLTDFLPLPIFDATTVNTFNTVTIGGTPPTGEARYGSGDTFHFLPGAPAPILSVDPVANSVVFTYGDYANNPQPSSTVEILLTVTVEDANFTDGLLLTNLVTGEEANTVVVAEDSNALVQLTYTQANLEITKGIVATDNVNAAFSPGAVGPVGFTAPGSGGTRFAGVIHSTNLDTSPIDSNLAAVDASDLVTFALLVENVGSGLNGAFDVTIRDTLPIGFVLPGAGLNMTVTDGAGTVLAFTDLGGGIFGSGIQLNDGPGAGALDPFHGTSGTNLVVITYDLQLDNSIEAETSLTNTATLSHYASVEGGVDLTPTDLINTATVTTLKPDVAKTIVSTNLVDTGSGEFNGVFPDVAIGEEITYRIVITMPEGITSNAVLTENLVSADGTLTLVSAQITRVGTDVSTTGDGLLDTSLTGNFNFGTVTNAQDGDLDTNDEIEITVVARVNDLAGNTAGDVLVNTATLTYLNGSDSGSASVDVVEPNLVVTKSASETTPDGGDTITYTVTVDNTGSASAFDVVLSDLLANGNLNLVAGTVLASVGAITMGNAGGDTTVSVDLGIVAVGDSPITITFNVQVSNTVPLGNTVGNTATANFTSLPSGHASEAFERSYSASDTEIVTIPGATLVKSVLNSTNPNTVGSALTIGEEVAYELTIRMAEGAAPIVLTDVLPSDVAGVLTIVSSTVVSIGTNIVGSALAVGVSGTHSDANLADGLNDTVVFNFGTLTNAADGLAQNANDDIVVRITARVEDLPANADGDILTNTGTLVYNFGLDGLLGGGDDLTAVDTADVNIVEPQLIIAKTASAGPYDAGDTVSYSITVSHSGASTAAAGDIVIDDVLLPNLQLVVGSVISSPGSVVTTGNNPGDTSIRIDANGLNLGSTITITYDTVITDAAGLGNTLTNTVELDYDSTPDAFLPGDVGNPGRQVLDLADTVDLTLQGASVVKTVLTSSNSSTAGNNLTVGETVTYQVTATLSEGTAPLIISDLLPSDATGVLSVVSSRVVSIGANITGSTLAIGASGTHSDANLGDGLNDTARFNFGTVTNAGNNISNSGDQIVVQIVALVQDLPSNTDGDTLTNTATLTYNFGLNGVPGGGDDLTDTDTADINIIEPQVTVTKAVGAAGADPGDIVTYTLTLAHTPGSTATAADLVILDAVANANISLVTGSVVANSGVVTTGNAVGDTTIQVDISTFGLLDPNIVITYQVQVSTPVPAAITIPNTVTLNYDSTPGLGGRAGNDTDTATFVTRSDVQKDVLSTSIATTGTAQFDAAINDLVVGEEITYELVLRLPEGLTQNVLLTDNLPFANGVISYQSFNLFSVGANLTLNSGPPTATVSDVNLVDGFNDRLVLDFGNITNVGVDGVPDPADQIVVRIVGRVEDVPANSLGDRLTNNATLNFSIGGIDLTSTDTADVEIVEPVLDISKSLSKSTADAGDTLIYTVAVRHAGQSSADAFDLVIGDLLDPDMQLISGSVTSSAGVITTGNTFGDTSIRIDVASLLLVDPVISISYQAVVNDSAKLGSVVNNTIQLSFDQLTGAGGRVGTDSASANVTLSGATLEKSVVSTSSTAGNGPLPNVQLGDTVTYELTATLSEGTANLVISDTLPFSNGVFSVVSGEVVSVGSSIIDSNLQAGDSAIIRDLKLSDGLNDTVIFDFGQITNVSDNVSNVGDRIVVRIVALVEEIDANRRVSGEQMNTATVDFGFGTDMASASVNLVPSVGTDVSGRFAGGGFDNLIRGYFGHRFEFQQPLLRIDPIFSGVSEPGTRVSLTLSNLTSQILGHQSVITDIGGNWLIDFSLTSMEEISMDDHPDILAGSRLFNGSSGLFRDFSDSSSQYKLRQLDIGTELLSLPYDLTITQDASADGLNFDAPYNTRVYFSPSLNPGVFGNHGSLDVSDVLRDLAENPVDELSDAARHPLSQGLNKFNHEFLTASGSVGAKI